MTSKTVLELERALADARLKERLDADRLRDSVTPEWVYVIVPSETRRGMSWDTLYDDSCAFYTITGEVTNRDQCLAVGHDSHTLDGGSMRYLFNKSSGRIVCGVGGGRVFVSAIMMGREQDGADVAAFNEISQFVVNNPNGGDITEIITAYQQRRNRKA